MLNWAKELTKSQVDLAWTQSLDHLSPWPRRRARVLRIGSMVWQSIGTHGIIERASSLSLVTLMGLVPVLATGFSVASSLGLSQELEPFLYRSLGATPNPAPNDLVGQHLTTAIERILEIVREVDPGRLGALGILFTLAIVVQTIGRIEEALNRTWGITRARSLGRKFSDYLSVLLIVPLLMLAAITHGAGVAEREILPGISLDQLIPVLPQVPGLSATLLAWAAFSFLYFFLPNTRVAPRSAAIGAFFAALSWALVQRAWVAFQLQTTQLGLLYGGFAALPLFISFALVVWILVLLGGELAHAHQHHRHRWGNPNRNAAPRYALELGLATMAAFAQALRNGRPQLALEELTTRLQAPGDDIAPIIDRLVASGWLTPLQDGEQPVHVLAHPPTRTPLTQVAVSLLGDSDPALGQTHPGGLSCDWIAKALEHFSARPGDSLDDLLASGDAGPATQPGGSTP